MTSASSSIAEELPALRARIDREIGRRLEAADVPPVLREALAYAALGPGKRLRPICVLLSAEAAGGCAETARSAACAVELVHAFSLVHDDLPAMDNDAIRRGRPTLHVHAGEATAILVGDLLLTLAFAWVEGGEPLTASLHRELTQATCSMICGQAYDTVGGFPDVLSPAERLDLVHRLKTGALIRAACRMGGIAAAAPVETVEMLGAFGSAIGLMFQIVDDLLDVTQTTEHLGKAAGKDQSAGKLTYPGLFGVEASRSRIESLRLEAHRHLEPLGPAADRLRRLCDMLAARTR